MYTASSKVVYKKLPLLGLLLSLSKPLYDFVISLFSKFGYDCRSCVYLFTIQYLEYENQLF